jgi:hypothetical protein
MFYRLAVLKVSLASLAMIGLLVALPTGSLKAQSCGCSICGCFRTHPISQQCEMPALEPCHCWKCLGEN